MPHRVVSCFLFTRDTRPFPFAAWARLRQRCRTGALEATVMVGCFPAGGVAHRTLHPPGNLTSARGRFQTVSRSVRVQRNTSESSLAKKGRQSLGFGAVSKSPDRRPLLQLCSARNRRMQDGTSNTEGHRRSGVLAAPRPGQHR
ncbi:hypothetical protein CGRA01v4_05267 [Colletotrichum graminicola]|nr:hypothetical protein CGRA01v4_05267 [Colletotrichum graminicola]